MDHLRDRHGAALSVCRPFRPDSLANVSRGGALRARPWLPSDRAFGATCARYLLAAPAALSCARYLLTASSALPALATFWPRLRRYLRSLPSDRACGAILRSLPSDRAFGATRHWR